MKKNKPTKTQMSLCAAKGPFLEDMVLKNNTDLLCALSHPKPITSADHLQSDLELICSLRDVMQMTHFKYSQR